MPVFKELIGSSARLAGLRVLAAACGAVVAATPAAALSCLPWGPADAYLEAANSSSAYNVIAGELRFDETQLPRSHSENPEDMPELSRIPAQISGKLLDGKYFSQRVSVPAVLEVECAGPWCAGARSGVDYLLFAEQRGGELVVRLGVCGGFAFDDTPEVRRTVLQCHRGGSCAPLAPR